MLERIPAIEYHALKAWGPVSLVGFTTTDERVAEREALFFLFEVNDDDDAAETLWPADMIVKNWIGRVNERLLRAAPAVNATLSHVDQILAWANQTHALADDQCVVFGDRLAQLMHHVASEVQAAVSWAELRIERVPRDPKGLNKLFLDVDLWAFNQWRLAIEQTLPHQALRQLPGRGAGILRLLSPAIERLAQAGVETPSEEGWMRRIQRIEKRIRAGQRDNLMADVLCALRNGPYGADGRLINVQDPKKHER